MPIYEYACNDCKHEFETIQKVSEAPLSDCPECGQASLRKKLSAVAFRLKGGGWYETDFKAAGKRNLHGDQSDSSAGDGGKASEKTANDGGKAAADKPAKEAAKPDSANGKSAGGGAAKASAPAD